MKQDNQNKFMSHNFDWNFFQIIWTAICLQVIQSQDYCTEIFVDDKMTLTVLTDWLFHWRETKSLILGVKVYCRRKQKLELHIFFCLNRWNTKHGLYFALIIKIMQIKIIEINNVPPNLSQIIIKSQIIKKNTSAELFWFYKFHGLS